jgi:hypothetical protein
MERKRIVYYKNKEIYFKNYKVSFNESSTILVGTGLDNERLLTPPSGANKRR